MHPYVERTIRRIYALNSNEKLFLQAINEVLDSLSFVLEEFPEIEDWNLLERICEPERQKIFRINWMDDKGKVNVNRGFRVGFSSALGPYKGGLRFHPSVDLSVIKFLAFEQVFKNSLTGLSLGAGKGGSDFDPKAKSEREVMRFCQAYMTQLYRDIGHKTDVPAGDIGVGSREIGFLFGQYKRLTDRHEMGVLTGKEAFHGGSFVRKEATGYGTVYFAEAMLASLGDELSGKQCIVSGSGNVAIYAIEKLQGKGANVIACSDSDGVVYAPNGIQLPLLKEIKEVKRGRLLEYAERCEDAKYVKAGNIYQIPCYAAFPCATQNELDAPDAQKLIGSGIRCVAEGANMPCTSAAVRLFRKSGVLYGPGKAANAGGVTVSGLEMQQNASIRNWSFEDVDAQLKGVMISIHEKCSYYGQQYGTGPSDYVAGANIAGFLRVVKALMGYGVG
ncbi:MAG: NADP-specific glutamate dehydrogenase [Puniceicoccaceae bacterium]